MDKKPYPEDVAGRPDLAISGDPFFEQLIVRKIRLHNDLQNRAASDQSWQDYPWPLRIRLCGGAQWTAFSGAGGLRHAAGCPSALRS
jgi:hypothetical protein